MQWEHVPIVTGALTAIGTAIAWVYGQWAKRAEKREDRMIENLERERDAAIKERDAARASASRWRRLAVLWHGQLLRNDIEPDPAMDMGGDGL